MKFTVLNVVMLSAGIVFIYSAIKNLDPREVVKGAIKGELPKSPASGDKVTDIMPIDPRAGGSNSGPPPKFTAQPGQNYTTDDWQSVVDLWQQNGGLKFQ